MSYNLLWRVWGTHLLHYSSQSLITCRWVDYRLLHYSGVETRNHMFFPSLSVKMKVKFNLSSISIVWFLISFVLLACSGVWFLVAWPFCFLFLTPSLSFTDPYSKEKPPWRCLSITATHLTNQNSWKEFWVQFIQSMNQSPVISSQGVLFCFSDVWPFVSWRFKSTMSTKGSFYV